MFGKKCYKCNKRISSYHNFCPNCGSKLGNTNNDKSDYGMLGKDDIIEKTPLPKSQNFFMEKFLDSAMKEIPSMIKMIEKQIENSMEDFDKIEEKKRKENNSLSIKFFVNGRRVQPINNNNIKVKKLQKYNYTNHQFSEEQLKKISKLERKEPKSKIRRLAGKIIYELEIPGVKDKKDIQIDQLENSIEVKAISKNRFYTKNLNVNFPIIDYFLDISHI